MPADPQNSTATNIPAVDAALSAFYHAKGPWGSEHRKAMRAALVAYEAAMAALRARAAQAGEGS